MEIYVRNYLNIILFVFNIYIRKKYFYGYIFLFISGFRYFIFRDLFFWVELEMVNIWDIFCRFLFLCYW